MVAGDHTPASLGVGKPLFFTNAHTELDRGVENVPLFVPVVIVPAANRRCSSFSPMKKLKEGAFFSRSERHADDVDERRAALGRGLSDPGQKTPLLRCHLITKNFIILPRQARDKHIGKVLKNESGVLLI